MRDWGSRHSLNPNKEEIKGKARARNEPQPQGNPAEVKGHTLYHRSGQQCASHHAAHSVLLPFNWLMSDFLEKEPAPALLSTAPPKAPQRQRISFRVWDVILGTGGEFWTIDGLYLTP